MSGWKEIDDLWMKRQRAENYLQSSRKVEFLPFNRFTISAEPAKTNSNYAIVLLLGFLRSRARKSKFLFY